MGQDREEKIDNNSIASMNVPNVNILKDLFEQFDPILRQIIIIYLKQLIFLMLVTRMMMRL